MSVPDEVPCILQVVSEYLKEPCPITSLSGSQGPTHHKSLKHPHVDEMSTEGKREEHQVNTLMRIETLFVYVGWNPL